MQGSRLFLSERARRVQAFWFDLGNVLVNFDHRKFCRALARIGGAGSEEEIHRSVLAGGGPNERFETGRISAEDFYREVSARWAPGISLERFREVWCDIFRENPGMDAVVQNLKGSARLVLVSNTNPWHMAYLLERYPFLNCFDARVLSYEVGVRKPEPEMFEAALAAAGAPANQCLYFDDLEEHLEAARRLGVRTALLRFQGP